MKRFFAFFFTIFMSFALTVSIAEAKRLGSGSNIGKQRTVAPQQQQATPMQQQQQPMMNNAAQKTSSKSKWLGPLAGLAAGLGLAALFSSLGLGEEFGSVLLALLIGGLVLFLVLKFMRKSKPAPMQYAGAGAGYTPPTQQATNPQQSTGSMWDSYNNNVQQPTTNANQQTGGSMWQNFGAAPAQNNSTKIPAGFPVDSFIRSAKTTFIRLQAANDRKDLNDIREYTTPEMFAEISMLFQERGNATQQTQVIGVEANLLEVVEEGRLGFASVRFTAQLSENGGPVEHVDEIWNVQKDLNDNNAVWLLAGIQQTVTH